MAHVIKIFDTTLRDGEQCPGGSMNRQEKLSVAKMLAQLNVDIIEAGFPVASEDDFEGVKLIAQNVKGPVIAALARAREKDIDAAAEAIRSAERGRIHTFLATSDGHMQYKLKMTPEEVMERAVAAVKYARRYTEDVEFSPEDATRSDYDFLCRVVEAVIHAGATTINIPDTVGYAQTSEFGALIRTLKNRVPNMDQAMISVHCHNDLGLATANSLAAIREGAGQVHCTINGIGERAGNASLEEVVMALHVRKDFYNATTAIHTQHILSASRLVSEITGLVVQPNKAVVGANAFAHESGIHQDGLLKDKRTYEIMTPASVGLTEHKMVLGKHSGRHALTAALEKMGYTLNEEQVNIVFEAFKRIADQKKEISEDDLKEIVSEIVYRIPAAYTLKSLQMASGIGGQPMAAIELEIKGDLKKGFENGDGQVDALYKAIKVLTQTDDRLVDYEVRAVTEGTDALGRCTVRLEREGKIFLGKGADPDIIVASAKAYINALNKIAMSELGPTGNPSLRVKDGGSP